MSETTKKYREPETEIEIMNAQLRIARWAAEKITELQRKLDEMNRKNNLPKPKSA